MKKIFLFTAFIAAVFFNGQFKVVVETEPQFSSKEAILFTINGSKDIVSTKEIRKGNSWNFQIAKSYSGMMKIYFPESNTAINFISENRDINIFLKAENNKVKNVVYRDEANVLMDNVQDLQRKNEEIFPALVQIKDYYKDDTDFGIALKKEIDRLNKVVSIDAVKYPFIYFYNTNYNKYLVEVSGQKLPTQDDISSFIYNSNEYLESSSLLRPLLVNFLNLGNRSDVATKIDALLKRLDVTTPRGQTVLSEFIDIFDVYSMADLKEKYLSQAKNLKCTINERLASTLKANKNVELGSVFPDYQFISAKNTTAKSLHNVKASTKVILFWSSTCSHCEAELPKIMEKYQQMKAKNIEVIGLSLDSDKSSYVNKIAVLPWINDSELKGWNSSYAETYNIHATPTYFILDANNKIIAKPDHVGDVLQFLNLK